MRNRFQRGAFGRLSGALALSAIAAGLGICLYSLYLAIDWRETVADLNFQQQLAAFIRSEFLGSLVLTVLWSGRLLTLWSITRLHDRLTRYRAMRRWRKLVAVGISGMLAATASFWALLLAFEIHPIAAFLPAMLLPGSAMCWLEGRVAFGSRE